MKGKWFISIEDNIGFNYYDVTDYLEIVNHGDYYNVLTHQGDIFLEKEKCTIWGCEEMPMELEYVSDNIIMRLTL